MTETKTEICTQCEHPDIDVHWDWCPVRCTTATAPIRDDQAVYLIVALHDMADKLSDNHAARTAGPHLRCSEADSIAAVLAYSGHVDAAARWILGHAKNDDHGGDTHAGVNTHERALLYVRHVWGMEVAA